MRAVSLFVPVRVFCKPAAEMEGNEPGDPHGKRKSETAERERETKRKKEHGGSDTKNKPLLPAHPLETIPTMMYRVIAPPEKHWAPNAWEADEKELHGMRVEKSKLEAQPPVAVSTCSQAPRTFPAPSLSPANPPCASGPVQYVKRLEVSLATESKRSNARLPVVSRDSATDESGVSATLRKCGIAVVAAVLSPEEVRTAVEGFWSAAGKATEKFKVMPPVKREAKV